MSFTQDINPKFLVRFLLVMLMMGGLVPTMMGQQGKYKAYFDEAYETFPTVPQGLLEAIAYTNTRLTHLDGKKSCQDIPSYFGVMGLVEDGKGYFNNSLSTVADLSGYSLEEIKQDPRTNILAYASAYSKLQSSYRLVNQRVETHQVIVQELSEIPRDETLRNRYATDQQFYGILREIQNPHTKTGHRLERSFDVEKVFGKENYRVLSAPKVTVSEQRISTENGEDFRVSNSTTCTGSSPKPDFEGAIWKKAHSNNFGSRGDKEVKFITIHTVQGSYASCISWFRNKNARVSAHYVIRASDGQVTQMVCEKDRAFHVKTDNAEAIGIEHEGFIDDGIAWYTQEMYEASAELVRDICKRHNIEPLKAYAGPPVSGIDVLSNECYHIKGHQHFRGNNHIDPGPFWDWERYYRLINGELKPKVLTAKKGEIIDSGKKTKNYGNQERVAYLIKPKNAVSISLDFVSFNLEGTNDDPFDYLDIYDGEDANGRYLGRFTGTRNPGSLISNSGAFFIEFRSDCRTTKTGYHLRYQAQTQTSSCPAPTDLIATDRFPMGAKLKWKGEAESYVLQVKHKNESVWQEYTTSDDEQVVTGLSANGVYEWQVRSACASETSGWVGQNFLTLNVTENAKPVVYTVRANSGKFLDTGGSLAGYSNKENYIYRIIPPNGGKVELSFSKFDTEDQEDFLTIYDGLNINSDPKVGSYSGKTKPPTIQSSGNGLSIMFVSDPMVVAEGWMATWRSVLEGTPGDGTANNGNNNSNNGNNSSNNGNNNGDPTPPDPPKPPTSIEIGSFSPDVYLHRYAPETSPILESTYFDDFKLSFKDRDRSGRGFANRFYTIAQETPNGFLSNPESGFFYDDFDKLSPQWEAVSGTWFAQDGKLVQSDASVDNSNLFANIRQDKDATYVYNWKSMMKGNKDNIRHGIHFFCSDPGSANRGNSYFVWIRKTNEADYVEIYKSAFNQFERKERKEINLGTDQAHDYKVIYNPVKGKIEVYMDNRFAASWRDSYPLQTGKGISLRTGNSTTIYEDLRVYQARKGQVSVKAGDRIDPISQDGNFKVESLVIDGFIHWSKPVSKTASYGKQSQGNGGGEPDPDPGSSEVPPSPGLPTFNRDFEVELERKEGDEVFALVTDNDGTAWKANTQAGFLLDEFNGSISDAWTNRDGNWAIREGKLVQSDESDDNSNLYIPLIQGGNKAFMYHFKAKLLSTGTNRRFGVHLFASTGDGKNRGNSYLLWFRSQNSSQGRVEVYRSDNNTMPGILKSKSIRFEPNIEYDVKIVYKPEKGQMTAYLNNREVLDWIDPKTPHRKGSFISLRTGNSKVEFDDLRVYQAQEGERIDISVGNGKKDMLRFKSNGDKAAGRLRVIKQDKDGKWGKVEMEEFIIR